MARLVGVDLPREKRIEAGIQAIYGIGPTAPRPSLARPASTRPQMQRPHRRGVSKLSRVIENDYKSKATSGGKSLPTSSGLWTSTVTGECATRGDYPLTDSAPIPTPAPKRARRATIKKK